MRTINEAGLELIKSFEGFSSTPYLDSTNIWTIGYGHTAAVNKTTPSVTEDTALGLLQSDIASAETQVTQLIKIELNDNQYAALVSLVYNTGSAPLRKTLGQLLNQGDYEGAANQFIEWIYAGGVKSNGLMRRRLAEKALFETPIS